MARHICKVCSPIRDCAVKGTKCLICEETLPFHAEKDDLSTWFLLVEKISLDLQIWRELWVAVDQSRPLQKMVRHKYMRKGLCIVAFQWQDYRPEKSICVSDMWDLDEEGDFKDMMQINYIKLERKLPGKQSSKILVPDDEGE